MSQPLASNPNYPFKNEKVWYLSHPLAGDDKFNFEENMAHTLHCMQLCYEEGFRVIAPYHTMCLCIPNEGDTLQVGLEVDCVVAYSLGRIIMMGHRISRGMRFEKEAVERRIHDWTHQNSSMGGEYYFAADKMRCIVDLTKMSDAEARTALRALKACDY